jgi:hypothetical protein
MVCRAGGCARCDSVNWGYIGLLVVFGTALCFCLVHLKKGEVRGRHWELAQLGQGGLAIIATGLLHLARTRNFARVCWSRRCS